MHQDRVSMVLRGKLSRRLHGRVGVLAAAKLAGGFGLATFVVGLRVVVGGEPAGLEGRPLGEAFAVERILVVGLDIPNRRYVCNERQFQELTGDRRAIPPSLCSQRQVFERR